MNNEFTTQFFKWIEENNIDLTQIAAQIGGVGARTIANWKSEGVPERRKFACEALMEKTKNQNTENNLNLKLTDTQLDLIEKAATIVQTPLRDYIIRSTIARARQDIAHQKIKFVAEKETQYNITDPTTAENNNGGKNNTA